MAYKKSLDKLYVVDDETGQKIKKKEAKSLIYDSLEAEAFRANQENENIGDDTRYKVVKIKNTVPNGMSKAEKGSVFNKMFRIDLQEIMKKHLIGKNAKIIMMTLIPFLHFRTNSVRYEYRTPTLETLAKLCDLSYKTFILALKELEENGIVQCHKTEGQTVIYFDPYLISSGPLIEEDIKQMFVNSRFNY